MQIERAVPQCNIYRQTINTYVYIFRRIKYSEQCDDAESSGALQCRRLMYVFMH